MIRKVPIDKRICLRVQRCRRALMYSDVDENQETGLNAGRATLDVRRSARQFAGIATLQAHRVTPACGSQHMHRVIPASSNGSKGFLVICRHGVACAGGGFEAFAVEDRNFASVVTDDFLTLQLARSDGHTASSYAEHGG